MWLTRGKLCLITTVKHPNQIGELALMFWIDEIIICCQFAFARQCVVSNQEKCTAGAISSTVSNCGKIGNWSCTLNVWCCLVWWHWHWIKILVDITVDRPEKHSASMESSCTFLCSDPSDNGFNFTLPSKFYAGDWWHMIVRSTIYAISNPISL